MLMSPSFTLVSEIGPPVSILLKVVLTGAVVSVIVGVTAKSLSVIYSCASESVRKTLLLTTYAIYFSLDTPLVFS